MRNFFDLMRKLIGIIRNFLTEETAKLREMNFTDKRQYIWEYYKLQLLGLVIVLALLGSFIHTRFNPPKGEYLYIAWMSHFVTYQHLSDLSTSLNTIIDEEKHYEVLVRSYVFTGDPQMDHAIQMRFFSLLSIGSVDAVIQSKEDLEANAIFGIVQPVHGLVSAIEALDPEMHSIISDRLLTITFDDIDNEGETITDTMAICIQGSPLLTALGFPTDDLYIGIVINSEKYYELAKAIIHILTEGGMSLNE